MKEGNPVANGTREHDVGESQDHGHSEVKQQKPSPLENTSEYANYFCEYNKVYHQKDMLEDVPRMQAYHQAIVGNPDSFKDKVVLDVGAGTGVLAMWAAQAGAKKVYAVEATAMARHARNLVKSNKLDGVVEVWQSKMEEVELPCKVDVIVSEWMGYLLVRESMLDSVLYARDKFLKEGGALFPSHAHLCWGGVANEYGYHRNEEAYSGAIADWHEFVCKIQNDFNLDMTALTKPYEEENYEYYLNQAYYKNLHSEQILAENCSTTSLDLSTITTEDVRALKEKFSMEVTEEGVLTGLACWFVVYFQGSLAAPTQREVVLDTSPHGGRTHWGQQLLHLPRPVRVEKGDLLEVTTVIGRHKDNDRMVHCTMGMTHTPKKESEESEEALQAVQKGGGVGNGEGTSDKVGAAASGDSPTTSPGAPRSPSTFPPKLYHIQ